MGSTLAFAALLHCCIGLCCIAALLHCCIAALAFAALLHIRQGSVSAEAS
jgi:hypothetical protein